MKRDYDIGIVDGVTFFTGIEVEHTPAFGLHTLFVTGIQSTIDITSRLAYVGQHIFFGANHSYNPQNNEDHKQWEDMIYHFLKNGYLCSLDIPINQVEEFNDSGLCERDNFIPQIRVPIPYIKLWNYNTMLKIDDKDFKATNPGVWCHSIHELKNRSVFTDWSKYSQDAVIKESLQ